VKITEGSSHAVDSDKYVPGGLFPVHLHIILYKVEGTRHQYKCRPTHIEMQSTAYETSSARNLLWPMLLLLLMDVPTAYQEFQNKSDMKFSNSDEQLRR